ncbi:HAMP domain-containing histidine kinase [Riemerella anatipestifer]|uniref:sensor histidine kinase n=1 Tax=Riemerella anatipestifer TaxID=34085 RepID=UPI001AD7D474|nr:HAMP domain-containing sensor histidine kinase [Riemerella anatipestifer]MBO4234497.1 HAMP domain-containing histidine kinase [Riemerella anatipestifer]
MPQKNYRGFSIRNRIFFGFLLICILSIVGSTFISYMMLRQSAITQNKIKVQQTAEVLTASLDYAISRETVTPKNIKKVLNNKIKEIADINKHDIIIYDLEGQFLLSNKNSSLIKEKKIPNELLKKIISSDARMDIQNHDSTTNNKVTSSYLVLKNNIFEPIGIVYYPSYHSDISYSDLIDKYIYNIFIINLLLILTSIILSWFISRRVTRSLTKISEFLSKINLFNKELKPIRYNRNDELSILVKSYNSMIYQIDAQKERLTHIEKETAWREMAKQVAHEVKNPLTPMKLLMQSFERRFDANAPDVEQKVKELSDSMITQIDIISKVATAFSEFAKLPEKEDHPLNLNEEIKNIITIFNNKNIFFHSNQTNIIFPLDKSYFTRILNNLITNAIQAESENRKLIINIDLEERYNLIRITIEDNGEGMSEDKMTKIFEPNFTSKSSGMGLGLTMVKKMIEEYKGSINVESVLDKGTKFIITIPKNI